MRRKKTKRNLENFCFLFFVFFWCEEITSIHFFLVGFSRWEWNSHTHTHTNKCLKMNFIPMIFFSFFLKGFWKIILCQNKLFVVLTNNFFSFFPKAEPYATFNVCVRWSDDFFGFGSREKFLLCFQCFSKFRLVKAEWML